MRFAHPQLLWLLLVVPPMLLAFLLWAARRRQKLLTAFIQARLLPDLTAGISPTRERWRRVLLTAAAALLILALARPQWGFTWEEARQRGLDVIVAIDTSKSMLAEDIAPNRLARAKLAALELMQTAKSDRLGLVAFAGTAFLQCPMTIDDAAFRQSVEMLDVNTLPQGGTAVGEAIRAALDAFKEADGHRVLVLITDGEDHDSDAVTAAREAAEKGLRLFTIGVGSPEGELLRVRDAKGRTEYLKDADGNVIKSRLNEALLQEIAAVGNGFYLPLRGAKTIETLYEKGLAPLPKSDSETKLYKRYHERYHWPLALAIALLVAEMLWPQRRRRNAPRPASRTAPALTATLLLLVWLPPESAHASASRALRAYQAGDFDAAQREYQRLLEKRPDDPRLALNAGTAAHQRGEWEAAEQLLEKAVTAPDLTVQHRAYYNRGHARFARGDAAPELPARKELWQQSLRDFEAATKLDAQDADARHNYEFVKKKLEELEQQQDQSDKSDQSEKDQQKDQQKSQQQNEQKDQSQNQSPDQKQEPNEDQSQPQDSQPQPDPQQKESGPPKDSESPSQAKADQQPKPQAANQAGQRSPDQMTPEQAMRVLDTVKGDERMLPVQPVRPADPTRPFKDW